MIYLVNSTSNAKLEQLKENLKKMNKIAIGFSGGVDSSFLLKVASDTLGRDILAVTVQSAVCPQIEVDEAKRFAELMNVPHMIIDVDVEEIEEFKENTPNRCYYCKKHIFSRIKETAEKEHISHVLDASNYDDLYDYRPGMKALEELGIISPLIDVKLTKNEIRKLSKQMHLDTWDKPTFACLASRFPYDVGITKKRLHVVEEAENVLQSLGVKEVRVRYHKELARIEVNKDYFQLILGYSDEIAKRFRELGFKYITLDIEGYRTGSLNEVLTI